MKTVRSLKSYLSKLERRHGGLRAAARVHKIDAGYWVRLRDGQKINPSESVLLRLGLRRRVVYVRTPEGGQGR